MNRAQRRAGRIRAPGHAGGYLYPELLAILERDKRGRPTLLRWAHDEETVGEVIPKDAQEGKRPAEMLLVFIGEAAGFSS